MPSLTKLLADPVVRLFVRALLVGGIAFATKYIDPAQLTYGAAALRAALVAGGLAFAEVFTPLNQLVGVGATPTPAAAPPAK